MPSDFTADDDSQSNPPACKKAKLLEENNCNANADDIEEPESVVDAAWQRYSNYLDSCDEENNPEGDVDELLEMMEMVESSGILIKPPPLSQRHDGSINIDAAPPRSLLLQNLCTKQALLPVLMSVAANIMADQAIQLYLHLDPNGDGNSKGVADSNTIARSEQQEELLSTIQNHLTAALDYFPENAAALSMAANFGRMTARLSPCQASVWYSQSAASAGAVRDAAIHLLEQQLADDDGGGNIDDSVKEWIELLLLNQITGVEFIGDIDNEEDFDDEKTGDEGEEKDTNKDKERKQQQTKNYNDNDQDATTSNDDSCTAEDSWSASAVEGTARFMAAMLLSMQGQHEKAVEEHLIKFDLTHRLHPAVWTNEEGAMQVAASSLPSSAYTPTATEPAIHTSSAGILPENVYQRLCQVFRPDAPYWKESDYANRGYYSYYQDLPPSTSSPTNLIEHVVMQYLLPAARQHLQEDSICGFEWWVHTRNTNANLGHNLHFDTDEALLAKPGSEIAHPILSSVLYLTGGDNAAAGATIVFDQTPDAKTVAKRVWKNTPFNNSFLVFPGNLLHGVLPCSSSSYQTSNAYGTVSTEPSVADLFEKKRKNGVNDDGSNSRINGVRDQQHHRLTLMIGFWTRRCTNATPTNTEITAETNSDDDNSKKNNASSQHQELYYRPCGPLPPSIDEHSWVQDMEKGYGRKIDDKTVKDKAFFDSREGEQRASLVKPIPCIFPAWEYIENPTAQDTVSPFLEIPRALDHRFFVKNAPQCFRESLFERDDDGMLDEDNNDDDDEDEDAPQLVKM